jgi:hypothetical protein
MKCRVGSVGFIGCGVSDTPDAVGAFHKTVSF